MNAYKVVCSPRVTVLHRLMSSEHSCCVAMESCSQVLEKAVLGLILFCSELQVLLSAA